MSTLLTSNGSSLNTGYLVMSDLEASEDALKTLDSSNTRFHSNYNNCIRVTEINHYPSPTSTINTYIRSGSDMKYITFALPSSTGIYATLFNNSIESGTLASIKQYYVYNTTINKSIFISEKFSVHIDVNYGHITNFVGTDLKLGFGYNNIDDAYLTSISLFSFEDNTVGMEFINNPASNILVEVITNFNYTTADKAIIIPTPISSTDIELNSTDLKINGVSITNTPVIGIASQSTAWVSHKPYNTQSLNVAGNHYNGDYAKYMTIFNHIYTPVTYNETKLSNSELLYKSSIYPNTFPFIATYMYPRAKWIHRWNYNDSNTFSINRSDTDCIFMVTTSSKNANVLIFYPYYYTDAFPLEIDINLSGGVYAYSWTELQKSGNTFTFVEHSINTSLSTLNIKFLILEYYKF